MTIALWIVQVLLALLFGMAGIVKLSRPKEKLEANMPWAEDFSPGNLRLIGFLELLAAVGLILPALAGILPVLTAWAATGLVLTMVGAIVTHARRKEPQAIGMNVVLLALAAFVAVGRFTMAA